jgi:hypothetical protein
VLGKASEPVESSNACTDWVLGCTFDDKAALIEATCADEVDSQALTELHIEYVRPVASGHALRPEITYEPLARYAQLAKQLKQPRGFKTTEHLTALRASSPKPCQMDAPANVRASPLQPAAIARDATATAEALCLRAHTPLSCAPLSTQAKRRVSYREDEILIVEHEKHLETHAHGHGRRGVRVSSKKTKSPRLSPRLSPRAKSPKASPRSPTSPGLRHATVALMMDALELPSSLVKSVKRAELDHLQVMSRCSRYTLAAQRAPKLFQFAARAGPRAVR